jgi:ribosome-associated protein
LATKKISPGASRATKKTVATKKVTKTAARRAVKKAVKSAVKKAAKKAGKTAGKTAAPTAAPTSAMSAKRALAEAASRRTALAVANAALEHKALNVEIIDVRGKVDYADYVVVMSGRSDRQVASLARNIEASLVAIGERCISVEGLPHANWLLMDYGDVIVHIFHADTRGYYDLERLWMDAARVPVA